MTNPPIRLATARGTFRVAVDGDAQAPVLVLGNSLGTTLDMWEPQVPAFAQVFRVIRYDTRGHGGSPVTPGPYSFEELGLDVLAVLDALDVARASFCGISMGGHTGLWLGAHAGDRLLSLVVSNSAARIGALGPWMERAAMVRAAGAAGMRTLADSAPGRWFTAEFAQAHPAVVQRAQAWIAGIDPEGYAACCEALGASDLRHALARIDTPTLLVAGDQDPVTTVADAQAMHAAIRGSQLVVLPASHLSNLETPQVFSAAVLDFLAGVLVA